MNCLRRPSMTRRIPVPIVFEVQAQGIANRLESGSQIDHRDTLAYQGRLEVLVYRCMGFPFGTDPEPPGGDQYHGSEGRGLGLQ